MIVCGKRKQAYMYKLLRQKTDIIFHNL